MSKEELRRVKTFVGAVGRKIRLQMRDPSTGAAYDLTGFSSATISGRFHGAEVYKIQAAAMTIEVGTDGWAYFFPTSTAIDTAGELRSQVRLDSGSDIDFSNKFIIEVEDPEHYTP